MAASSLLSYARAAAGLSQQALGARAAVTQASISRIEDGRVSPRFDTLERLLEACGFSIEILRRSGEGIDRTAMRQLLRLSPAERARIAVQEARNLEQLGRDR